MSKLRWNEVCVLWNGEAFDCGTRLCCKTAYAGLILNLSRDGGSAEEPPSRDALFWKRLKEELPALDLRARAVLQNAFPGENIAALPLTELVLDQGESYGAFALGYDAGDTQAGRLYLFVPFDEDFQPCGEPICEVC
ncbi:hypothetical protein [Stomatobaculum longum]